MGHPANLSLEQITAICHLWADGKSYDDIAAAIHKTRGTVGGVCFRLGLKSNGRTREQADAAIAAYVAVKNGGKPLEGILYKQRDMSKGRYWSDEDVERLKALHGEGKTNKEIADAMGVTPERVGNKMRELNLASATNQTSEERYVERGPKFAIASADELARVPMGRRCQFIEKDPRVDATKCGQETVAGRSYCPHHLARCYVKPDEVVAASSEVG